MIHVAGHDKDTGGSGDGDRGHGVGLSGPLMEGDGGGQWEGILDWGLETGLGVSGRWGECLPGCRWGRFVGLQRQPGPLYTGCSCALPSQSSKTSSQEGRVLKTNLLSGSLSEGAGLRRF